MVTDLTTLTDAELAERAAACLGLVKQELRGRPVWAKDREGDLFNAYNVTGEAVADWDCDDYSPATNDAQAAELMRFAVAKCGAMEFAQRLAEIRDGERTIRTMLCFLATADARARTIAAISCLTSNQNESEGE